MRERERERDDLIGRSEIHQQIVLFTHPSTKSYRLTFSAPAEHAFFTHYSLSYATNLLMPSAERELATLQSRTSMLVLLVLLLLGVVEAQVHVEGTYTRGVGCSFTSSGAS